MAYVDVNKISTIRFMCHKILPLVYDESLSYYEVLCKVANKLNETIEATNQLNDDVVFLNTRVTELNTRVDAVEAFLNDFEARMNKRFQDLTDEINKEVDDKLTEVDDKVNELDIEIINLKNYLTTEFARLEASLTGIINDALQALNERIDVFYFEVQEYLDKLVQEFKDSIPDLTNVNVINPVTGELSSIQIAIDDMFTNTRYNAFTIDEYNHLKWDINKCNKLLSHSIPRGWSIIEWLTNAKEYLNKRPDSMMYDAISGELVKYKKEVEQNTDMFRVAGCLSVSEIGELNLTFDDFIAYGLSCFNLAWWSNRLLTV